MAICNCSKWVASVCTMHPLRSGVVLWLDLKMNLGSNWGTLLTDIEVNKESQMSPDEKEKKAFDIAKKDEKDTENLRLYMIKKNALENLVGGKLKKKINKPCRYGDNPENCWPHMDGCLCPFMHRGEEGKFNFNGKGTINLIQTMPLQQKPVRW